MLNIPSHTVGTFSTIEELAEFIGCTRAHIYKTIDEDGEFTLKNNKYRINNRF